MWDLPRPGVEPASPASAGRFLTTRPPWKSFRILSLTVVPMLYIRSPELLHRVTESLYALTLDQHPPISPIPQALVTTCQLSDSIISALDFTCKRDHMVFVFLWLFHLTYCPPGSFICCSKWQVFFFICAVLSCFSRVQLFVPHGL